MQENSPVNFMKPLFDIGEWIFIRYIIDYNNSMCASVITWCDGSKSLLTSSIPLFQ